MSADELAQARPRPAQCSVYWTVESRSADGRRLESMSELGDLLELLHEAHFRESTLRAEYREWLRPRPNLVLGRSEFEDQRLQWRGVGPFPRATVGIRRIWLKRPASLRVEMHADNKLIRFGVLNRRQWWRWDVNEGAVTSEAPNETNGRWWIPPLLSPPLLEPVQLLMTLRLQPTGRGVRAGRDVVCAGAIPRTAEASGRTRVYELEFDAEYGTMLRRSVFDDGLLVATTAAVDVEFDGNLSRGLFEFTAPDGEPTRRIQSGASLHDGELALRADESTADEGIAPACVPTSRS